MLKKIAILGFGKLGKALFQKIQTDADWQKEFHASHVWNRSAMAFQGWKIPNTTKICSDITDLLSDLSEIDLVVECAHPSVLHQWGRSILAQSDLFVSSPTAFSNSTFYENALRLLQVKQSICYVPLGASVGAWDVIRLDQNGQLKDLLIEMRKHPQSFRIHEQAAVKRLELAMNVDEEVEISAGSVGEINQIAPQNTNTMSIYALIAKDLGFSGCQGRILADRNLPAHIVTCSIETTLGLTLQLERYNPANHQAVTGKATFSSFFNSLLNHTAGIPHNNFVFC